MRHSETPPPQRVIDAAPSTAKRAIAVENGLSRIQRNWL